MEFFAITNFNLDLFALGVGVAATGILGFLVYFNNRKSITNLTFFLFCLITIFWGISNFFEYKFTTTTSTLWALRTHLFISVWHAVLFFQLCFVFPESRLVFPRWYRRIFIPTVFLTALLTLSPFVFVGITKLAEAGQVTRGEPGPGILLFMLVAVGCLLCGLAVLFRKILKTQGAARRQTVTLFIGMILMACLILFFNVLLPNVFNDRSFIPYAALFMLPFIALTSYSIYRYRLFNIKVFFAGALIFVLAALTFIEVVFTTETPLLIFRGAILALILATGIQLVRSVMREIEQREHIEQLAESLRQANEKLKELDKLKSQFLSIASHDLRSPLTVIRNFMSLLLEGTYGKLPPAGEEGLRQVFERATDMAKSVDTYLNVSRIEQGKMKYDFVEADLVKMVKDAVTGFRIAAEQKGLTLNMSIGAAMDTIPVKIDRANINEVLNNLLDNAIKYTPKGSIYVALEKRGNVARISIKDSGKGIDQKTKEGLFKLFSPGEDAKKINPNSTGVGLYITKAHVEAHGGTIRAESEGEGKGSTFIVELPILASKKCPLG